MENNPKHKLETAKVIDATAYLVCCRLSARRERSASPRSPSGGSRGTRLRPSPPSGRRSCPLRTRSLCGNKDNQSPSDLSSTYKWLPIHSTRGEVEKFALRYSSKKKIVVQLESYSMQRHPERLCATRFRIQSSLGCSSSIKILCTIK